MNALATDDGAYNYKKVRRGTLKGEPDDTADERPTKKLYPRTSVPYAVVCNKYQDVMKPNL